jgi:DNA-binding NarL/FixJ family response regulator
MVLKAKSSRGLKSHPRPTSRTTKARSRVSSKISILVADDQAMDRRGLIALLESQPDFEVVAEAATGHDAASRCKRFRPDVVVLSIRLPDLDGVSAISFIRAAHPATHVIALAERGAGHCLILSPPRPTHIGLPMAQQDEAIMCTDCLQVAVSEGALGALRRDAEPDQLFRAVRTVAQGNAWYEPRTAAALLKRALPNHSKANGTRVLSAREVDVAGLIADGRSNKEIGRALGISEPTVKKHVGHVLAKLGLQDRLQIGIYIIRNPLLFGARGRRG